MNTKVRVTKSNQTFIKKTTSFFVYKCLSYREREGSFGEASFGGSYFRKGAVTPASEVSFCL